MSDQDINVGGGYCRHGTPNGMVCAECESELPPAHGSPAHVHFEIKTEAGNSAMILGDPNMPEATRKALAAMIDAVVKMSNASENKVPENND